MKIKDISGQRFGRLTALYRLHNTKGRTRWLCVCDCGNLKEVYTCRLTGNKINKLNWSIERTLELEVK